MENSRLEQIPILHVRGTHSVIGFTIVNANIFLVLYNKMKNL